MPKAPRVAREGKGVARDPKTGNLIGGVRPPWVKVPSAAYLTDYESDCGTAYSAERLQALYGSYANYSHLYETAKRESIKEGGYLLPEDAVRIKPIASPTDFEKRKRAKS